MFKFFRKKPAAASAVSWSEPPSSPAARPEINTVKYLFHDPINGMSNAMVLKRQGDVLQRMRFEAKAGMCAVSKAGNDGPMCPGAGNEY